MLAQYRLQGAVDQAGLPTSRHACHTNQLAQRKSHIHVLQVVPPAANQFQFLAIPGATNFGHRNLMLTGKIFRGKRIGQQHLVGCSGSDNLTTMPPGKRPHVNQIIGRKHHVFVVFYHDHGVARVSQFFERTDQTQVVAVMQADAGFIQDVEHIHQL